MKQKALCIIRAVICSAALFVSNALAMAVEQVGPALHHPWGLAFLNQDSVLVTERDGRLLRINLVDGSSATISGLPPVFARSQGGLLDVIVDDDEVYLCYAAILPGGSATAIDHAKLEGNALVQRQTIFTGNNPTRSGHHFGCRMQISNGMLYASLGDRGDRNNAQDPAAHAGSLIRIHLDGSIPDMNPQKVGWAPEIFTIGHRNPQGMARHPLTGNIWAHEHGPRGGDEINIIRPKKDAGANYGWPAVSHGREYVTRRRVSKYDSQPGYVDPVWVWDPSIAPSGMAFYPEETNDDGSGTSVSKQMFPTFQGHLLVGSLKFRQLYLVELGANGLPVRERVILDGQIGRIRDVAVVPHGPFAGAIMLLSDEAQGGLYMMRQ